MKEELKEEWVRLIRGLDTTAENVYTLLNPVDRDSFIKLINVIAEDMFKLKQNGSIDRDVVRNFRLLAIQYLIEFEKDNKEYVYVPMTNPITYPGTYPYPDSPAITNPCPYPYQLPVIYCTTVS